MSNEPFKFGGNDALNYEQWLGPLIFEPSAIEFLKFLTALPAQSILETSCGSGRLTNHLRKAFPASTQLVATDLSADMLALAQKKLKDQEVEFKVADGQQLPFDENTFDLVVNQYGLMFFPDKQKGFDEAYRVLRPDGHFAFATWDRTSEIPFFKLTIDDNVIPFFKEEDTSRFHQPFSLHDPRQLLGYLKNAGFKDNQITLVDFKGTTDTPMNIVNALFLKHRLAGEVASKAPEAVSGVAAGIEKSYTDHFGAGPFEFGLQAWIGIGRK